MSEEININEQPQEDIRIITADEPQVSVTYSGDPKPVPEQVTVIKVTEHRRWPWIVLAAVAVVLAVVAGLYAYKNWVINYYTLPISVTPQENIAKLAEPAVKATPDVVMTTDSILGVQLHFYELKGLKASIELIEPSAWDRNVYLYTRSADVDGENKPIGSLVSKNIERIDTESKRKGYFAAVGRNAVIGISPDEDEIRDYCHDNGGCFFRQFVLVSNGQLPPQFFLHGKVERRALARKPGNNNLFYVEAPNPETMWDFADALREYGFIDAIYVTGGNTTSYYRVNRQKGLHLIGNKEGWLQHKRSKGYWLVFRK